MNQSFKPGTFHGLRARVLKATPPGGWWMAAVDRDFSVLGVLATDWTVIETSDGTR
jgi:hypothetical protein